MGEEIVLALKLLRDLETQEDLVEVVHLLMFALVEQVVLETLLLQLLLKEMMED